MESRINGTLKTWNKDKGFGFITPLNGGLDIFVHISDYPRQGGLPKIGEPVSFEVTLNKDGKKKAIFVQRPRERLVTSKIIKSHQKALHPKKTILERLITLALVIMLGYAGYTFLAPKLNKYRSQDELRANTLTETSNGRFRCDGRTHCSEMTSCAEATFFIRNCPDTKMDGNGDGVPCEAQWCKGIFAK